MPLCGTTSPILKSRLVTVSIILIVSLQSAIKDKTYTSARKNLSSSPLMQHADPLLTYIRHQILFAIQAIPRASAPAPLSQDTQAGYEVLPQPYEHQQNLPLFSSSTQQEEAHNQIFASFWVILAISDNYNPIINKIYTPR